MSPSASLVIRVCAAFDLCVTGLLALPIGARVFVEALYALEPALGGAALTPALPPLAWLFANLAGVLGVLWAGVRLARPAAWLARADAAGRCAVAALILLYLAPGDAPRGLAVFIVTELAGAAAQLWVTRR
jgi:hypothetical protein